MGNDSDRKPILVFELDGNRYGLVAAAVREVLRAVAVVPLPRSPSVVEGVFDLRGEVVPLFDLRGRFGLPARPIRPADHYVVASCGGRSVAIRADRVIDLVEVPDDQVRAAREVVAGCEYVAGLVRLPDGLVLVHDLETFLSAAEAATLGEALASSRVQDDP